MEEPDRPRPSGDAASRLVTEDLGPYSQAELAERRAGDGEGHGRGHGCAGVGKALQDIGRGLGGAQRQCTVRGNDQAEVLRAGGGGDRGGGGEPDAMAAGEAGERGDEPGLGRRSAGFGTGQQHQGMRFRAGVTCGEGLQQRPEGLGAAGGAPAVLGDEQPGR